MKKIITLKEFLPILIIAIMFLTAWGFYNAPCLPDKMPSHWNAAGQIDGWSGKTFSLLFAPLLALAMYLLLLFLPLVDPLRKNYQSFALPYYFIRLALVIFLALFWALPWKGMALWKAARLEDKWWFIALLVSNTLGLLEILYIFVFSKRTTL